MKTNNYNNLSVDKKGRFAVSMRNLKTGESMFYKTGKTLIFVCLLIATLIMQVQNVSAAEKKYRVIIDPAHGGQDSGVKISDKIMEKDVALSVALALQKELAQEGNLEVILTRDSDKMINSEERRKDIAKKQPDLLISLHINGGFGKSAAGFEIYYPGFKEAAEFKKQTKAATKEVKDKYLKDSRRFAQILQKNLDALFPRKGRGLREAQTPILEGLEFPAVVAEIGFISNPEERKKLLSSGGQTEIAKALAKSIKLFF